MNTPARDRFLRGTDVLHGEQVEQYAATTRYLMRRGLVEPIGPRFSRAAVERAAWSAAALRGLLAETGPSDRLGALHAGRFPAVYEATTDGPMYGPQCAARLASALLAPIDPNGHGMTAADREAWTLEAEADALLRAAGHDVHRVDIRDPRSHRMTVVPDRVAYRGATVTTLPETADDQRAVSMRTARVAVRSHKTGKRTRGSYRLVPLSDGPDALADVLIGRALLMHVTELETIQLRGRGQCWHILGHGLAVLAPDRIATRKVRRARRAVAAGRIAHKSGRPEANPISADARTVRRRWAKATADQRDAADRIVAVLLTTVPGTVIGTGPTAVTVADDKVSASIGRGPLESVHAVARRLALAGTMLAD